MNILHLFEGTGIYVKAAIDFFSSYTWNDNHVFYIYIKDDEKPLEYNNADEKSHIRIEYKHVIKDMWKDIMRVNGEYRLFVFHMFPRDIKMHLYYTLFPGQVKKIVWVIWGADLYDWRGSKKFANQLRVNMREKIPYVVANEMDKGSYIEQFGTPRIFCELNSISEDPGYSIETIEKNRIEKSDTRINILIGHSATEKLNHIEVLDSLRKFKNEDICLTIPLNYGRTEYANKVSQYAISIFGNEKVNILSRKMELDNYMSLLWTCDIAIFHTDRQIALGNLFMLLYMKKKLYFKGGSVLKNHFDQKNLITYDSKDVKNISFSEFSSVQKDLEPNREFAILCIDRDQRYKAWTNLLSQIK